MKPCRLVVFESGHVSIFAGLGLGGKICNQVHFQFSLCTFAVFSLGRVTLCQPVSYTQPKISVTYLIFTAELTHGLAYSDSCSTCTYNTGFGLEASGLGLDLYLVVAGLNTSMMKLAYSASEHAG